MIHRFSCWLLVYADSSPLHCRGIPLAMWVVVNSKNRKCLPTRFHPLLPEFRREREDPSPSSQLILVSFCMARIFAIFTLAFSPSENLSNDPQSIPLRRREIEILSLTFPLFRTVYPENWMRISLPMFFRNELVILASASILLFARWVLNSTNNCSCSFSLSSSSQFPPYYVRFARIPFHILWELFSVNLR